MPAVTVPAGPPALGNNYPNDHPGFPIVGRSPLRDGLWDHDFPSQIRSRFTGRLGGYEIWTGRVEFEPEKEAQRGAIALRRAVSAVWRGTRRPEKTSTGDRHGL